MKLPKAVYVLLSWYLVGPAAGDQNAAFIQFDAPQFLIQCEPTKLTWQGGKSPYTLDIFWSNGPFDEPLQQYSNVTVNSVTWGTNVTAGLPVVFILDDSAGNGYGSASIVVQIGSDQSCLNLDSSKTNTSTTTAIGAGDAVSTNPASRTGSSQFASTATVEPTGSVATTGPRRSVPLIVGAAVGGTGGIMLTVIGALLLRRRYARKRDHVQPQMLQTNPGPLNQAELSLAMSEKSRAPTLPLAPVDHLSVPPSGLMMNEPGTGTSQSIQRPPASRRVHREVDAGSVHLGDVSGPLDEVASTLTLPPAYEDLPHRRRQPQRRK